MHCKLSKLPYKMLYTLNCKMPVSEKCETYPDSLIEITTEHEGKTPVTKGNQQ